MIIYKKYKVKNINCYYFWHVESSICLITIFLSNDILFKCINIFFYILLTSSIYLYLPS